MTIRVQQFWDLLLSMIDKSFLSFSFLGNPAISPEIRGFASRSRDRFAFIGKPAQSLTTNESDLVHRFHPC